MASRLHRGGGESRAAATPIDANATRNRDRGGRMAESVYKIIELVGTSPESWEKAASAAVSQAAKSLRDLRVAEVSQLDLALEDGKVTSYRAKVKLSFKLENRG
jgi:flavin-binding protein dodecin